MNFIFIKTAALLNIGCAATPVCNYLLSGPGFYAIIQIYQIKDVVITLK